MFLILIACISTTLFGADQNTVSLHNMVKVRAATDSNTQYQVGFKRISRSEVVACLLAGKGIKKDASTDALATIESIHDIDISAIQADQPTAQLVAILTFNKLAVTPPLHYGPRKGNYVTIEYTTSRSHKRCVEGLNHRLDGNLRFTLNHKKKDALTIPHKTLTDIDLGPNELEVEVNDKAVEKAIQLSQTEQRLYFLFDLCIAPLMLCSIL